MKFSNIFLTNQSANIASQTVDIELDDQALESVSGGCAHSTFNNHGYGRPVVEHENYGFGGHGYHQPSFHPCPPPCHPYHQRRHY